MENISDKYMSMCKEKERETQRIQSVSDSGSRAQKEVLYLVILGEKYVGTFIPL